MERFRDAVKMARPSRVRAVAVLWLCYSCGVCPWPQRERERERERCRVFASVPCITFSLSLSLPPPIIFVAGSLQSHTILSPRPCPMCHPSLCDAQQRDDKPAFDFSVNVLTQGAWPFSQTQQPCTIPVQLSYAALCVCVCMCVCVCVRVCARACVCACVCARACVHRGPCILLCIAQLTWANVCCAAALLALCPICAGGRVLYLRSATTRGTTAESSRGTLRLGRARPWECLQTRRSTFS